MVKGNKGPAATSTGAKAAVPVATAKTGKTRSHDEKAVDESVSRAERRGKVHDGERLMFSSNR